MKNLLDIITSLNCSDSSIFSLQRFESWLQIRQQTLNMHIEQISFADMKQWAFEENTGNLVHQSGRFYSIEGIHVSKQTDSKESWEQPIIVQPEIGYLGIITQKKNGILHFLMQAKAEPGNLGKLQLSPTLQATKSNYLQIHKGNKPLYLDYFRNPKSSICWVDQLQSEQGARFLKKRNRNMIIEIDCREEIPLHENFCWLTLGQLVTLLQRENLVNMDSRTVLSCLQFTSEQNEVLTSHNIPSIVADNQEKPCLTYYFSALTAGPVHQRHDLISWITRLKSMYELEITRIPLNVVKGWRIGPSEITHHTGKYFSVMAVRAQIQNREVFQWDQPMVRPAQSGIIAFIIKKINGAMHFLVQAKLEAGNFDILELAPTVQCLTGNYRKGMNEYEVPFLDYVLTASPSQIVYDVMQSEEGGRFYQEENRNLVIEADEHFGEELPDSYVWMTLPQLKEFLQYNNYLNMAARSIIAVIQFK